MQRKIGKKIWAIAEGYIPAWSNGPAPEFESHEAICLLNCGAVPAVVHITLFFSDRDPVGPYSIILAGQRSLHQRMNDLKDPPVPRGSDYSVLIESSEPIVVQHTRLDSRQAENALLSTIAYSE